MIDLYYWPTPNGWKITIMLAECDLDYRVRPVNISTGEQYTPEFLSLSLNNRIPVLVDHQPSDGGDALTIFESGAILIYLAEKTGNLMPSGLRARKTVLEWLMWQVGGLGPTAGQNGHFLLYATERIPYAIRRYGEEIRRLYGVLDQQLARTRSFVAGDYSIADIAIFPWIVTHKAQGLSLADYPHVDEWFQIVRARPAVSVGMETLRELRTLAKTGGGKSAPPAADGNTVDQV